MYLAIATSLKLSQRKTKRKTRERRLITKVKTRVILAIMTTVVVSLVKIPVAMVQLKQKTVSRNNAHHAVIKTTSAITVAASLAERSSLVMSSKSQSMKSLNKTLLLMTMWNNRTTKLRRNVKLPSAESVVISVAAFE